MKIETLTYSSGGVTISVSFNADMTPSDRLIVVSRNGEKIKLSTYEFGRLVDLVDAFRLWCEKP